MPCLVAVKVVLRVLKETVPDEGFEKAGICRVIDYIVVLCVTVLSRNTESCGENSFHSSLSLFPLSFSFPFFPAFNSYRVSLSFCLFLVMLAVIFEGSHTCNG